MYVSSCKKVKNKELTKSYYICWHGCKYKLLKYLK